jgi:hypothetical protein
MGLDRGLRPGLVGGAEVRIHPVGPFLMDKYKGMAESAEAEQKRLADGKALTARGAGREPGYHRMDAVGGRSRTAP